MVRYDELQNFLSRLKFSEGPTIQWLRAGAKVWFLVQLLVEFLVSLLTNSFSIKSFWSGVPW